MLARDLDDALVPDTARAAKRSGEAPEPPATEAAAALWSELGNRCLYLTTVHRCADGLGRGRGGGAGRVVLALSQGKTALLHRRCLSLS
jgi:hypothetical protein